MASSPVTVKELINLGANLRITRSFSPVSLKEFVKLAVAKNLKITIAATDASPVTLKELVKLGGDYLTLEI